jgi:dTMP kinase
MLDEKGKNNGLFLSIEGPDGAGKTTQARLLKERLEKLGLKVVLTREPGGTPIGEEIRKLLLNPDFREMTVPCEVLLYSAARAQLINQCIYPSLKKGLIVISDRYLDSNLVYQGLAGGEKPEIIETINMWATGQLLPEITFLLDIDVESGLLRLQGKGTGAEKWRGDRMEQKELEFHCKVRQGFLQLASRDPKRFFVIQAGDGPEVVHEKIWGKIQELLREKTCFR